jgi:hypothetical protein
LGIIILSNNF